MIMALAQRIRRQINEFTLVNILAKFLVTSVF